MHGLQLQRNLLPKKSHFLLLKLSQYDLYYLLLISRSLLQASDYRLVGTLHHKSRYHLLLQQLIFSMSNWYYHQRYSYQHYFHLLMHRSMHYFWLRQADPSLYLHFLFLHCQGLSHHEVSERRFPDFPPDPRNLHLQHPAHRFQH